MEQLQTYFQKMGFKEEALDAVTDAFTLQSFDKNDLVVMEG